MADPNGRGKWVGTRVPPDLYTWLESEQARMKVETGLSFSISSVVRSILAKARERDAAARPPKQARSR